MPLYVNDNKIFHQVNFSENLYSVHFYGLNSIRTFSYIFLLTGKLAYLYGRIQSPRPDVMPDRREGIMRVAGFGFARIDTQASELVRSLLPD